jgi:hypothetical protein
VSPAKNGDFHKEASLFIYTGNNNPLDEKALRQRKMING